MGKQKGRFGLGKYVQDVELHIKAKRVQKRPVLDITVRLTEENVAKHLRRQIDKFLEELKSQAERRAKNKESQRNDRA
jgi:hypothetical protein